MPRKQNPQKPYIDSIIEEVQKAVIKEKLSKDFRTNLLDPRRVNITDNAEMEDMYYCNFSDPSEDGILFARLEAAKRIGMPSIRIIGYIHAIPKACERVHHYSGCTGIIYETKLAGIPYMIYYDIYNLYYNKATMT